MNNQAVCLLISNRLAICDDKTLLVVALISNTIIKALRMPNLTLWNKV
jgi:hypothetical protein